MTIDPWSPGHPPQPEPAPLDQTPLALEPSESELRELADACFAFVEEQRALTLDELAARPAPPLMGKAPRLDACRPASLASVLDELRAATEQSWNTGSPRYMAFVPGGGLPTAVFGDFLALALNRYVTLQGMAPGLARVESSVVRWLCDLVGYPDSAFGVLTSGGSASILTAVIAAREARLAGADLRQAALYVSEQGHASVHRAARAAGLPPDATRVVPVDTQFQLDPEALSAMIERDRWQGRRPFLIVASAGTTNTGSVDPLAPICDVARRHDLWVHADAAYGGFFILTERGRRLLEPLHRCDSITLDPHKGLFLPYGTGALVVRDRAHLVRAFARQAGYLRDLATEGPDPDAADLSFELSRELRGLRVWLPLRLHGVSAFREALDEKLDLAQHASRALAEDPRFELVSEPQLSTVAFRVRSGRSAELLESVNASGRALLSSTLLRGDVAIRLCILGFRTHLSHVDEAIAAIRAAAT